MRDPDDNYSGDLAVDADVDLGTTMLDPVALDGCAVYQAGLAGPDGLPAIQLTVPVARLERAQLVFGGIWFEGPHGASSEPLLEGEGAARAWDVVTCLGAVRTGAELGVGAGMPRAELVVRVLAQLDALFDEPDARAAWEEHVGAPLEGPGCRDAVDGPNSAEWRV